MREVIVIIKTHFDIGYTHRVEDIVHHYRTDMIDRAMAIMDQSKSLPPEQQFAWTGPGCGRASKDAAEFTSAKPVNLRGESSGNALAINAGKLEFPLRAFAPASFVLE